MLDKHQDLFKEELRLIKGLKAKIHVNRSRPEVFQAQASPFCPTGKSRDGTRQVGEGRHNSACTILEVGNTRHASGKERQ